MRGRFPPHVASGKKHDREGTKHDREGVSPLMLRLCGKDMMESLSHLWGKKHNEQGVSPLTLQWKHNGGGEIPCLSHLCGKKHDGEGVSPLMLCTCHCLWTRPCVVLATSYTCFWWWGKVVSKHKKHDWVTLFVFGFGRGDYRWVGEGQDAVGRLNISNIHNKSQITAGVPYTPALHLFVATHFGSSYSSCYFPSLISLVVLSHLVVFHRCHSRVGCWMCLVGVPGDGSGCEGVMCDMICCSSAHVIVLMFVYSLCSYLIIKYNILQL